MENGDVLIVTKLDRLGRDAMDVRKTVEQLAASDIRVHCLALPTLMLPESQRSNFAEMKRTFINPVLKKINANTPLKAAMKQNDDGRLVFTIVDAKN